MHPLRVWRSEKQVTLEELGRQIGMSLYELHRIETLKVRSLSVADAMRIARVTRGKVSMRSLAEAHPG